MQRDALTSERFEELAPTEGVGPVPDIAPRITFGNVCPEIEDGKYPAKAVLGDVFAVECDVLTDGHEQTAVALRYRAPDAVEWVEVPMRPLGNDRWQGQFKLERRGTYEYTLVAWRDAFATWLAQATAKKNAGQKLDVEFEVASGLLKRAVEAAAARAAPAPQKTAQRFRGRGIRRNERGSALGHYRGAGDAGAVAQLSAAPVRRNV